MMVRKASKRLFLGVLMLSSWVLCHSQVSNLPVKDVDGVKMYYYVVAKGETLYSLSRKLDISLEEIERWNPSVKENGLKADETLYFPVEGRGIEHVVQSKETVYGIAKKYGITQKQLSEWNPWIKDGIKPGQRLVVSAPSNGVAHSASGMAEGSRETASKDGNDGFHVIGEGETLYKIATDYNTTVSEILKLNPALDKDNYKAGTIILLPGGKGRDSASEGRSSLPSNPVAAAKKTTHIVKKKETFFSISHQYGITVEALERANPGVGVIREGMALIIPTGENDEPETEAVVAEQLPTENGDGNEAIEEEKMGNAELNGTVDIALILPLMVNSNSGNKQAQLYREFYKGFLVGIDSLRDNRTPIKLLVYDTGGTMSGLEDALKDERLAKSRVIVAPDDAAQLKRLGDYGLVNNIDILNLFVVNDQSYKTNPKMIQGNIPHDPMYEKAVKGVLMNNPSSTTVFLKRKGGSSEKSEFVDFLKSKLTASGRPFMDMEFEGSLQVENLKDLKSGTSYMFVPLSGKQDELKRIIPGLVELQEQEGFGGKISLFGYPEWISFRGEILTSMHNLNTYIYSRFYYMPDDYLAKRVDNSYLRWYGEEMSSYVPRQGLLGFDTAYFLVEWLTSEAERGFRYDEPKRYYGVQNGFEIKNVPGDAGKINDCLYLINYRPNGMVDKTVL